MKFNQIAKEISKKKVQIFGGAWSEGQKRKGTETAPDIFREANLINSLKETLNLEIIDGGNIFLNSEFKKNSFKKHELDIFQNVGFLNEKLSQKISETSKDVQTLILGGDHSLGCGSIHGQLLKHGDDLKVIWIDAHADINTPKTSSTKNYHGMPLAHILGFFEEKEYTGFEWMSKKLKKENLVLLGIRDLDEAEKILLKDNNIFALSTFDIDNLGGIKNALHESFKYLNLKTNLTPLHVSFDVDSASSEVVNQTGTPSRYGLTEREIIFLMRKFYDSDCLVNLDVVEINTTLPGSSQYNNYHGDNQLIKTNSLSLYNAIEFIHYAFGKKHTFNTI